MVKVEMLVQVCINGRPIWRKAKPMRNELSAQMTDKEYGYVVDAAIRELSVQAKGFKERVAEKEKVTAK